MVTLKENVLKLDIEINDIKNKINMCEVKRGELEKQISESSKTLDGLYNKKNKFVNSFDQNNREITNIRYRIQMLENNLQNDSNLPNSVKNILNNNRFSGVHDIIGKLIDVGNEYKTSIGVALGGAFNYLVVDSSEVARELVNYLKDNKLGRATFFPIDTIKPRSIDEMFWAKVKNMDGVIDIAANLVKCSDVYRNIINNQLGNVIVVTNLEVANTVSRALANRYKIVTLDGGQVNVGGSITGGSLSSNQNLFKDGYELENKRLDLDKLIKRNSELEEAIREVTNSLYEADKNKSLINGNLRDVLDEEKKHEKVCLELLNSKELLEREIKDIESISNSDDSHELEMMLNMYYSAIANRDNIVATIEEAQTRKYELEKAVKEIEELTKKDSYHINAKEKALKELEIKQNTTNIRLDNLLISLGEEYNLTYEAAINKYKLEIDETVARSKVKELKALIKELGYVNVEAIEEYDRVSERYEFLNKQKSDLKQAEDTLLNIIKEMDDVMVDKFKSTYEAIRMEFKKVFREMFRGGEAELVLTDPDNLLETGIEIQAVPSGKNLKSLSLLSGGEKTFTAISLLFAILNVRPVPFCLLDEVEAALDEANVESFGNYLYKYRNTTQFILITHKKKTMEFADILYGITMQESGVSKMVSVKLEDIKE